MAGLFLPRGFQAPFVGARPLAAAALLPSRWYLAEAEGMDVCGRGVLAPSASLQDRFAVSQRGRAFRCAGPLSAVPSAWDDATFAPSVAVTVMCGTVRTANPGAPHGVVTKATGWTDNTGFALWFGYNGDTDLTMSINGVRATSGLGAIVLNQHYCLAGTYDGATIRAYVDGRHVASAAYTGAITSNSEPLRIGSWGNTGVHLCDWLAVWDRALSSSEVGTWAAEPYAFLTN